MSTIDWIGRHVRDLSRVMEIVYILIWVVFTQAYKYVKVHQAAYLRFMHFTVCYSSIKSNDNLIVTIISTNYCVLF